MKIAGYLTISPNAPAAAGKPPCSNGWKLAGISTDPPSSVTAFSKVLHVVIDIPDTELDVVELKLKWPDGEPDPQTVAELKQWTSP